MSFTRPDRILSETTFSSSFNTRLWPLSLCCMLFVWYVVVSLISTGFYQHDELGHLTQIMGFWRSPLHYLTDPWSRGGYKILYAIPTLFGYHAIVVTNILFTVGAAWNAYRIARGYQLKYAWLAILFTGLQPFVINLSFRCYAEIPAMFFLTLLVYLYQQKRWIPVALLAGYLFTIRAELAVFALILGAFFLTQKKWVAFLCLGIAPFILNLLGFCMNGDPLYLWHLMVQGGLKDTYVRMGFFYFWLMLPEISGMVVIFAFLTGYLSILYPQKGKWAALKKYHAVLIVFTVYFLMHCAFTAESFGFGRSGGVGRFMMVILPMVAVIALIGINFLASAENKWPALIIAGISFLLLFLLWYRMDKIAPLVYDGYITLSFRTVNIIALLLTFLMGILLIMKSGGRQFVGGMLGLIAFLYALSCVKPFKMLGEDKNQQAAVSWILQSGIQLRQVYANHPVGAYEYGKRTHNLWSVNGYNADSVSNAKPGDLFIVEEHYTYGNARRLLLSGNGFTVLKKVDAYSLRHPVWVVQRK